MLKGCIFKSPTFQNQGNTYKTIFRRALRRGVTMRKFFAVSAAWSTLLLAVPVFSQMGMMHEGGMMNMSMIRHHYVMQNGIDPRYASMVNPLKPTAKNIEDGKQLYQKNCALCHGPTGLGNGEAGKSLNPPPSNIAAFSKMPMATDGYLYWTIAEGGLPLGTAMLQFKSTLKEDEIWKIIIYLREI
jgi:mono/diheme cytochrome c family protein